MDQVKKNYKRIISLVTGKTGNTSVDLINFNALLFSGALIAFVSSLFNLAEKEGIILTCFTFFSFLILTGLYLISRFKNYYNIWLSAFIIMALLSIAWFMNGGAIGSVPYIYLFSLIIFITVAGRQEQNLICGLFLLNLSILYTLEYFRGDILIHPYPNKASYYNDMTFVFIMIFLCTFFLARFIKRMYEGEKDKAHSRKMIIEQQNRELLSSLTYASYIQKKIISNENQMYSLFNDYFVLFKPKNIVSGDFYWIKEKGKYGIVAAADCTGHGVPAAFLSILGVSLLEETIKQEGEELHAGSVLEKLRTKFIAHLQKNSFNEELRDGIDLSICIVCYPDNTFQFSGANRPLMLVRKNKLPEPAGYSESETTGNYTLYYYKSTKNTIGFNYKEMAFVGHTIEFFPNDTYYLFSDGYGDQFDSLNRKKITIGKLKQELLKIQELPMPTQEVYLFNLYLKWKGETEQTDDILLIGLRL